MGQKLEKSTSQALLSTAGGCLVRYQEDEQDPSALFGYCDSQEWIHRSNTSAGPDYVPTWKGRLDFEKRSRPIATNDRCFVAMWFDNTMQKLYDEGIEPALRAVGYEPYRLDREWGHTGRLDEHIEAQIRQSRFVVADFTSALTAGKSPQAIARGGVYYEAGLAQGQDIPVIFTCHKDITNHLHFDTRQYRHLVWEEPRDLYRQLIQHILAHPLLGRGSRDSNEAAIASVLNYELKVEHRLHSFMQELTRQWDNLGASNGIVPVDEEALEALLSASSSRDPRDMEQFWEVAEGQGWITRHDIRTMGNAHNWGLKSLSASGRHFAEGSSIDNLD